MEVIPPGPAIPLDPSDHDQPTKFLTDPYEFLIGRYGPDGPSLIADQFFSNPNQTFPFGITGPLELGSEFELEDGTFLGAGVEVTFVSPNAFGFRSTENHSQGPDNFIFFQFQLDEWGQTGLYVDSWGPGDTIFDKPGGRQFDVIFTKNLWRQFAKSLGVVGNQTLPTYPCCPDF